MFLFSLAKQKLIFLVLFDYLGIVMPLKPNGKLDSISPAFTCSCSSLLTVCSSPCGSSLVVASSCGSSLVVASSCGSSLVVASSCGSSLVVASSCGSSLVVASSCGSDAVEADAGSAPFCACISLTDSFLKSNSILSAL